MARLPETSGVFTYERSRLPRRRHHPRLPPPLGAGAAGGSAGRHPRGSRTGRSAPRAWTSCSGTGRATTPGANDVLDPGHVRADPAIEALEDEIEPLRQPSLHPVDPGPMSTGRRSMSSGLRERHGIIFSATSITTGVSEGLPPPDPAGHDRRRLPRGRRTAATGCSAAIRARAAGAPWLDHMLGAPPRAGGASVRGVRIGHRAPRCRTTRRGSTARSSSIHAHLVERTGPVRFTSAHPARGPVSTP